MFLLVRRRWIGWALFGVLLAATALATAEVRTSPIDPAALRRELPSGRLAFGEGSGPLALARAFSFTGYFVLVGGAVWSAVGMRGTPELRSRFLGTLWIAVGATIVAGGSAFAVTGNLVGFSLTVTAGVAAMFWGFLLAGRPPTVAPAGSQAGEGPRDEDRPDRGHGRRPRDRHET